MNPVAAAGKAFLAGEYAVLDGAPALVCGLDRALHARWEHAARLEIRHALHGERLTFAERAVELTLRACGARRPFRLVYQDDFSVGGRKLGLGGSAAACVIAVRAAAAAQGRALSEEEVVALAVAAHWAEQGGSGSGGDVAASALGGVVEVCAQIPWRAADEVMSLPGEALLAARPVLARPLRLGAEPRLLLAFAGESADTRALIRRVLALRAGNRPAWLARKEAIDAARESLGAALEAGQRDRALQAVRDGAAAMAALGEAAQAPVVTAELAAACALASSAGGAAKPSGAGGGDCAIALAFDDAVLARLEAALAQRFFTLRVQPA